MTNDETYFTPHITVACVVQAQGRFLVVEERIHGKLTINQPAGHLEADESLVDAMQRELYEETGLNMMPTALIKIHQWVAKDKTPFIRFTFVLDLPSIVETTPIDNDIEGCRWLTAEEILTAKNARSQLVKESIISYQQSQRYPLSILSVFTIKD